MSIRTRLERLERQQPKKLSFEELVDRYYQLLAWLEERGYADALAAVEAGEAGPIGLEKLLREQAGYDHKRRAFARIEQALDAGQLPDDADLDAIECGRRSSIPASPALRR